MKSLLIFASVLLVCQCNTVPQEVVHTVTVPVPSTILSAPPLPNAEKPLDIEVRALVTEVTKDQKPVNEEPQPEEITTVQPETTTILTNQDIDLIDPLMAMETQRKTRAVPFSDKQQLQPQMVNDLNVIRDILAQRKPNMVIKMPNHRVMRSVVMAEKSNTKEMVAQTPVIKGVESAAATIDPCDLLCTKFEFEPICATNGLCLHEFPNQCILETFNCKHKSGKFTATKDDRCQMHWLTKCEESELI